MYQFKKMFFIIIYLNTLQYIKKKKKKMTILQVLLILPHQSIRNIHHLNSFISFFILVLVFENTANKLLINSLFRKRHVLFIFSFYLILIFVDVFYNIIINYDFLLLYIYKWPTSYII